MSVTSMRSPMRTISLRTIAAHKLRLVLTILSVVLGTAFIAGSSMFTSSLSQSFTSMISSAYDDVDLVVQPPPAGHVIFAAEGRRVPSAA